MRIDRTIVAIAIAIVAGGWVCQHSGDNPCPGALTCEIDVANVCCPFGESHSCGGTCSATGAGCVTTDYRCIDESVPVSCDVSAAIAAVTCTGPLDGDTRVDWRLQATGTATGCGQEALLVTDVNGEAYGGLDCGTWSPGVFASCVPGSPAATTTTWSIDQVVTILDGSSMVTVAVIDGQGASLLLAIDHTSCGP